jgi:hypothetical protein
MNESIILRECSIRDKVEILGHVFHGLKEIESAVEISASPFLGDEINTELVDETTPDTPIQGVHVAEVWQSYPCFDFEDRMNEHRTYQNYFFSTKPFTPERLSEIYQKCNEQSDFALVNEDMPADLAPAVYYVGDYGKMVVATTAKGDGQRLITSQTIINLKNNLSDNTMSSQAHHKKYWVIGIIAVICIIAALVIAHPHHAPSYKYKDGKPVLTVTTYGDVPVAPSLEIPDDAYEFLYMDDIPEYQFQRKSNPAEYWLMNRMMQMFNQVTSGADTIWAWKYAIDESVAAYNRYIHRQIDGTAGRDMAMKEILDFSDYLNGGNTAEMTQGGYIASVVSLYQALDLYNNLIESTKDSRLRKLIFSEYYAWETYQEYDWDCIQEWKYSQEWYGDLPIEKLF